LVQKVARRVRGLDGALNLNADSSLAAACA
jgi:hypothetical protein